MRMINIERNVLRSGGFLKDRQVLVGSMGAHETSLSSPSKSSKPLMNKLQSRTNVGVCLSDINTQNYTRQCWKSYTTHYAKGGLIFSSFLLFLLLLIMSRSADWQLPCLYSTNSEAVQLIPPVLQVIKPLALQISEDSSDESTRRQRKRLLDRDHDFVAHNLSPKLVVKEDQRDHSLLKTSVADNDGMPYRRYFLDELLVLMFTQLRCLSIDQMLSQLLPVNYFSLRNLID